MSHFFQMKRFLGCAIIGLCTFLPTACTNYYEQQPEGYVTQTVPVGYTVAMIAGVSYWVNGGHYYRYWPNYGYVVVRPPYGRPPYQRPPNRPPHGGRPKPEHPIAKPPSTRPPQGRPPTIQPTPYPTTRPSGPSTRPSMPSTRPVARPMPSVQPRINAGGGKLRR